MRVTLCQAIIFYNCSLFLILAYYSIIEIQDFFSAVNKIEMWICSTIKVVGVYISLQFYDMEYTHTHIHIIFFLSLLLIMILNCTICIYHPFVF